MKSNIINQIKEWSLTFGEPVNKRYTEQTPERKTHIIELISSELEELRAAETKTDTIDGLGDVLWTAIRAFMDYGVDIEKAIDAIHVSNMSKLCGTQMEAAETVAAYWNGTHPDKKGQSLITAYKRQGKRYVVYLKSTGKVMKSVKFKEPDFSAL